MQLETNDASRVVAELGYPRETQLLSEMMLHVEDLWGLFTAEFPRSVSIWPTDNGKIRYVIGDASAKGFGYGTQYLDLQFEGRDGLWEVFFPQGGSNLREGHNLTNHFLGEIHVGKHDGCEVWCFTDNAVWSYVWTKELSNAQHLFYLMLELHIEVRKHEVYLWTCHLSERRMIATGMDGWSYGNHDAGVSLGYDICEYIPMHLGAWDVVGVALEDWCKSWG